MRRIVVVAVLARVAAAGCAGGGSAAPAAPTTGRLRVVAELVPCAGPMCIPRPAVIRRHSLTCRPDGGSMPRPGRACAALADLLRRHDRAALCLARPPREPMSVATVRGRFAGRPVLLTLAADASWCGTPAPVRRDLWALSAFPCDVPVVHAGGPRDRLAWARSTGCA